MEIKQKISLDSYTTFHIGGKADFLVDVYTIDEIKEAISFAQAKKIPFTVVGGWSNILVADEGYRGLIIQMKMYGIEWTLENDNDVVCICGAGEVWDNVVKQSVEKGLFGLENLSLIPGTVGATPIQNIGAYGAEVKRVIESVTVYDTRKNTERVLMNKECKFGYRDSIFKHEEGKNLIVTKVTYRLKKRGDTFIGYRDLADYFVTRGIARATPAEVREAVIEIRTKKLPDVKKLGNAGSFFKNPVVTSEHFDELKKQYPHISGHASDGAMKLSAAWLIDKLCNMKGVCVGDACVHDQQALVIINKGKANAHDVLALADLIIKNVKEKIGIELEKEVQMIK